MSTLLSERRVPPAAVAFLWVAALGVIVAGFLHARLFWRGYAEVDVVGPLFLLNGIGSLVVVLLLVFGRVWLFVLGSLAISVGSIVSILISHNSSFFGFSEGNYDTSASVILVAEVVATIATVLGAWFAVLGRGDERAATARGEHGSVAA